MDLAQLGFYIEEMEFVVEPGRLELWLDKVFGEKVEKALMAFVMVFSVVMAIGIFMVLPLLIANVFRRFISSAMVGGRHGARPPPW